MWKKRIMVLLFCMCMGILAVSCKKEEGLKDGYYTAEMSDYSHGWKEYVTICVMENKIVSVEYNAVKCIMRRMQAASSNPGILPI